jgi:hypothetical protein
MRSAWGEHEECIDSVWDRLLLSIREALKKQANTSLRVLEMHTGAIAENVFLLTTGE